MSSIYWEQIRKDIEEKFASKREYWMHAESDEGAKDYWRIKRGIYSV